MANTYKPKNILITGAAGFIASHVCNRIVQNYPDYKIIVLDKLDYCSNLKNLIHLCSSPNFKFIKGDIGSADLVNYILLTESIDTIMHFAAQTHVDNSFGNSFEFTKNNIYGTHVLLEACKVSKGQVKRFIHVSTDEVYGETDEDAVVGNHELLPTNPYSATKAGAEMLVMAYGRSYGLPVITTRGNNVYGPNQFPEKLIPKFLILAMKGRSLPIHGDGSNVRSYLYCEDVAEAFEIILHRVCGDRPFNDQRYFLDDEKLKNLGWCEGTTWEEGLRKTMDWYVKNPDWWGDVSGALLPHPRMLTMPGVEKYCYDDIDNVTQIASDGDVNHSNQNRMVVVSATRNNVSPHKASLKFLIYGGAGNIKPTHVFNASGVTGALNVKWFEDHIPESIRAVVVGVLTLADVCRDHGLPMMNYAFCGNFEDKTNSTDSFYFRTQAKVEGLLKEYENVCTLRIQLPVSSDLSNPHNFIIKITRSDKMANIPNRITVLDELVPISVEMAKRNCRGIWNFTNPGIVTCNEILEMYKDYVNPTFRWVNFTPEQQAHFTSPSTNEMDSSKLKKEFSELLPIKDSLIKYVFEPKKKSSGF
ncbi:Trifunctional UDP-glucose 4,6-dehydratase/UDP-4-keto-6-deoxy-D-glucose 3,5-epimerase/UDP-4-keto-L-rhamnose-reductase RHM1 [Glycine max]|nr:Trifunctional UDP-glucose 4,6-dehydratase/UDP-4-keto-6-deoxy-D-glucose 3,5-epimerase/UDP-4-keto-L-rhamnose-reductase RHM1 [Glycine max]